MTQVRSWSDLEEYRRLLQRYFGLRVLITDRSEWTTAQIVEAYRGQSRVEAAFRDLKDPGYAVHTPAISLDRSETACARIHVRHRAICSCACYGGARVATPNLPAVPGICSRSWRGFASAALSNIPDARDDRGSANRWKKSIRLWKTWAGRCAPFGRNLEFRRIYGKRA